MMRKYMYFAFNLAFFSMIVVMLYQTYDIYTMKKQVHREITDTEQQIAEYTEKKNKLESNIRNFSENEKIERVARDRLNLKKEGEITYRIID